MMLPGFIVLFGFAVAFYIIVENQESRKRARQKSITADDGAPKALPEASGDDELTMQILAAAKESGIDTDDYIRAEIKRYSADLVDSEQGASDWERFGDRVAEILKSSGREVEEEDS